MNEKTELSDERIKELAEQQGSWGASFGYSKESDFEKPVVPAHAYTFARAIEAELRAASPSSKSTKELSDEQIEALLPKVYHKPGMIGYPCYSFGDVAAAVRAALASSSIKEDGERAEPVAWLVDYEVVSGWKGEGAERRPTWAPAQFCTLYKHEADDAASSPLHCRNKRVTPLYTRPSSPPSPLGDTPDQQEKKR